MKVVNLADRRVVAQEEKLNSLRSNLNSKETTLANIFDSLVPMAMQAIKEQMPLNANSAKVVQEVMNDLGGYTPEIYVMIQHRIANVLKKHK